MNSLSATKIMKQSQAVGYKLNLEFGKLSNDRQSGALAKNVDEQMAPPVGLEPTTFSLEG